MILRRPTDALISGFAPTTKLGVTFADVTETAHAISDFHGYGPAAEYALAHTLASTCLMGAPIGPVGESASLRLDVPGPLHGAYAEVSSVGHLRGYVSRRSIPEADDAPAASEEALFGDSMDVRTFWSRPGSDPDMKSSFRIAPPSFQRLVEMFFLGNFHLPTRVRFAVRMDSAGVERAMAVMLQCLPGGNLRAFVRREELFAKDSELDAFFDDPVLEAASGVFHLHDLGISRVVNLAFRCDCSREQSRILLAGQPEAALRAAARGLPQVVTCQFCGSSYEFQPDEIRRILRSRGSTS